MTDLKPDHTPPGYWRGEPLISRRDHFAAAALTGLLAPGCYTGADVFGEIASLSRAYADALIRELDKAKDKP